MSPIDECRHLGVEEAVAFAPGDAAEVLTGAREAERAGVGRLAAPAAFPAAGKYAVTGLRRRTPADRVGSRRREADAVEEALRLAPAPLAEAAAATEADLSLQGSPAILEEEVEAVVALLVARIAEMEVIGARREPTLEMGDSGTGEARVLVEEDGDATGRGTAAVGPADPAGANRNLPAPGSRNWKRGCDQIDPQL